MGTRHLTCVVKDGEYKVAQYGQWDGYPTGQGVEILEFLTRMNKDIFSEKIDKLSFLTQEELDNRWFEFGVIPGSSSVSMSIADEFAKTYPENSRDTGSRVLNIIYNSEEPLKLDNNLEFAADSLFCEWAYVIDLDQNTFEVYEGFNKTPLSKNERFNFLEYKSRKSYDGGTYYPVKLIVVFSLSDLPSEEEFLNSIPNDDEEE